MSRYIKRPWGEPTNDEFLALLILLGPFAYVVRWMWRTMRAMRLLHGDEERRSIHDT